MTHIDDLKDAILALSETDRRGLLKLGQSVGGRIGPWLCGLSQDRVYRLTPITWHRQELLHAVQELQQLAVMASSRELWSAADLFAVILDMLVNELAERDTIRAAGSYTSVEEYQRANPT